MKVFNISIIQKTLQAEHAFMWTVKLLWNRIKTNKLTTLGHLSNYFVINKKI